MPPLMGTAVNVMVVPRHIGLLETPILTEGVENGLTVIVN